jgi:hypothetical protein
MVYGMLNSSIPFYYNLKDAPGKIGVEAQLS